MRFEKEDKSLPQSTFENMPMFQRDQRYTVNHPSLNGAERNKKTNEPSKSIHFMQLHRIVVMQGVRVFPIMRVFFTEKSMDSRIQLLHQIIVQRVRPRSQ